MHGTSIQLLALYLLTSSLLQNTQAYRHVNNHVMTEKQANTNLSSLPSDIVIYY